MIQPWRDIVYRYTHPPLGEAQWSAGYGAGIKALVAIATYVDDMGWKSLHGFTSHWDLCVQQGADEPYTAQNFLPTYLRMSPTNSFNVEFRLIDAAVERKEWHRTVPAAYALDRFKLFLSQIHWISDSLLVRQPGEPGSAAAPHSQGAIWSMPISSS